MDVIFPLKIDDGSASGFIIIASLRGARENGRYGL
jgi:hypothetical protein